jgi:dTDP-4-dehydrorhamnose reductase
MVLAYDRQSFDITNQDVLTKTILDEKPEVVINCAAWTDVDGCELDPQRAFAVNAQGPENLAKASRLAGALLITISTDYVFDGEKEGFYTQRDNPNPRSVYASSKLEGEHRAQQANARTIVARTGFVFGPGGKNFLSTVVQRARNPGTLLAIGDAYGTPTYSVDLAERLRELSQLDLPGVYHVVNGGRGTSFEGFAREVINITGRDGVEIQRVSMDSLKRPAPRPRNSRLRCLLSEAIALAPLREWRDALREYVKQQ